MTTVIGYLWGFMELTADSVSYKLTHNRKTVPFNILLHGTRNIVHSISNPSFSHSS